MGSVKYARCSECGRVFWMEGVLTYMRTEDRDREDIARWFRGLEASYLSGDGRDGHYHIVGIKPGQTLDECGPIVIHRLEREVGGRTKHYAIGPEGLKRVEDSVPAWRVVDIMRLRVLGRERVLSND